MQSCGKKAKPGTVECGYTRSKYEYLNLTLAEYEYKAMSMSTETCTYSSTTSLKPTQLDSTLYMFQSQLMHAHTATVCYML